MVCRFLESFDYYSTDTESLRKWTAIGNPSFTTIDAITVRTGLNSCKVTSGFGSLSKALDDQATWIVGGAWYMEDSIVSGILFTLKDASTAQMSLLANADGSLEVVRGTATAITGGKSAAGVVVAGSWNYVELKVTIANSIGASTCQAQVNGELVLTVDTAEDLQVTANATANEVQFVGNPSGKIAYWDDIYIFDGTGSVNIDFAGDVKVVALHPDGNGTTSDFTGSDADSVNNYLHVDETDTDDDTSYVESSTVGHIDLYTFGDLPDTPSAIHAIQVNAVFNKQDAGARTMRVVTRPAAANFFSPSITPSTDYLNKSVIYDEDPNTAGAWGEAALNATEFGVEIET